MITVRSVLMRMSKKIRVRIVPETGLGVCWDWTGSRDQDGYPLIRVGDKIRRLTRVLMMIKHNRKLEKWEYALHSCDRPCCCNPDHLHLGTQQQNIQEMYDRGRRKRARMDAS